MIERSDPADDLPVEGDDVRDQLARVPSPQRGGDADALTIGREEVRRVLRLPRRQERSIRVQRLTELVGVVDLDQARLGHHRPHAKRPPPVQRACASQPGGAATWT
jgi:hypothetical protein